MHRSKKIVFLISAAVLSTVPLDGFCADPRRPNPPMVQMLQEGKGKLSPDYKNIIDEKGNKVAKETSNTVKKPESTASSDYVVKDASAPPPPMVVFCNKKCAILTRHCYLDEVGNTVCLNVCEREALVCE
jgi:hypothetical protein